MADEVADAIELRFLQTRHKRTVPVSPFDEWWRDADGVSSPKTAWSR